MMTDSDDTSQPLRPEFFLTRVLADMWRPDIDILTVSHFESEEAILDLSELRDYIAANAGGDAFNISGMSNIIDGEATYVVFQTILGAINSGTLGEPGFDVNQYAVDIFEKQPIAVMNSPLSGKTLLTLAQNAGAGAGLAVTLVHPDFTNIVVYFVLIGGTKIVMLASDGIGQALGHGLSHLILKWMGVSEKVATPKKLPGHPEHSEREPA